VKGKKINGLESLRDEKLHTALRRSIAPSFTLNAVVGFEPQIDNAIEELMCHVDQLKTWDMTTWILYFAMDSFNNIAFSEDLGFMKNGCDIGGTLSSITLSFRYFCWFSTFPNLGMGLSFILSFLMGANNPLVLLSASRAKSRYNTSDPYDTRNDLLAHYVKIAKEKPDIVTLDTVTGLVLTNILAGADTTTLAIVTLIYHLLKNPSCLARLQTEINSAESEGKLSYPPQWKELSELRYLDATIKESLRLQDLLRFNMDRVVGSNGLQLCGTNLPPGTNVGALQHVIHRNRDVYGHDAEIYNPDRWLKATQSQVKTMERAAVWFGHGKRICIGQNIGKIAITKFISALLMRFNVSFISTFSCLLQQYYSA
jgi:cytochrome P450